MSSQKRVPDQPPCPNEGAFDLSAPLSVFARFHLSEQVLVGAEEMRFLRSRARARMASLDLKSAKSVVSYGILCVSP